MGKEKSMPFEEKGPRETPRPIIQREPCHEIP